jgi:hypothetical protein
MDREEFFSKFVLCVLMTQMGKTFTAIKRIYTEIEQDLEQGRSVHMVFTMNTLLNNTQFAKRLKEIEDRYGKGSVCVFASKYSGAYTHVRSITQLQGICLDKDTCPRVIVVCSNTKRFTDGIKFMKVINTNKLHIFRVFVYYDELHAYINDHLRNQIEEIHKLDIVRGILALTATPDKIWQERGFWSKINLIKLDDLSSDNYAGYGDMIFNCIDDYFATPYNRSRTYDEMDNNVIGFITHTLNKHPEILGENTRSFIPAHIRRDGHNRVRNLIFERNPNALVILLNGIEKSLQYKDNIGHTKTILLTSNDEEVCETIYRVIVENNLQGRPLVITGRLCVGMGQTLTHKQLGPFTHAIFGQMDDTNDDMYQLFGRTTGRMKKWDTYIKTQIYCPSPIMHRIAIMEECAKKIIEDHNGENVTQEIYRNPIDTMEGSEDVIGNIRKSPKKKSLKSNIGDKEHREFDSQNDAIQFAKEHGIEFRKRSSSDPPKGLMQPNNQKPTAEQLLNRMWGINAKTPARMVPTCDDKWCVYWRPSLLKKH